MCRLFGLSGGTARTKATFWLLEAPDSLEEQSRRNPDGTGLGVFREDGTPELHKEPLAAFEDAAFVREALEVESTTFVAHVRYATNGPVDLRNTHPFALGGRLFAHNGVIGDVQQLEAHLGADLGLVAGDTDSERYFALITRETARAGGDLEAGIAAAAGWMAANLPVFSMNFVLATPDRLYAFRYPENRELYVLERRGGGQHARRHLDLAGTESTRVRSHDFKDFSAVIVASEPMDENPGWRCLQVGELLCVGPDLDVRSAIVVDHPPVQPLHLQESAAGPGL